MNVTPKFHSSNAFTAGRQTFSSILLSRIRGRGTGWRNLEREWAESGWTSEERKVETGVWGRGEFPPGGSPCRLSPAGSLHMCHMDPSCIVVSRQEAGTPCRLALLQRDSWSTQAQTTSGHCGAGWGRWSGFAANWGNPLEACGWFVLAQTAGANTAAASGLVWKRDS